mmetsp:Transcript_32065/g.69169  ORF Transcript_32065/g.69169 Transcript_32065/m.69169 type:complete len:181 (+) Transcript_32065:113-655(+)
MGPAEAATSAVAKGICWGHLHSSCALITEALERFCLISCDTSWNPACVTGFLKLLLGLEDGLRDGRVRECFLNPSWGVAVVAYHQQYQPLKCRANEHDRFCLLRRYVSIAQELTTVTGVSELLMVLAENDPHAAFMKDMMRSPGCATENEGFRGTGTSSAAASTAAISGTNGISTRSRSV